MKCYLTFFVPVTLLLILLTSCNEDIIVKGDFKETAVVYGLLDQSDSVHFIKITRAFVGPGNALEISKIPDSNYFENIEVVITEELVNGSTGRTWTLFDTLVDSKETDGIFYAPEQKVYAFYSKSKDDSDNPNYEPLNAQATYHLHITIDGGKSSTFEVYGSTKIVSGISTSTDAPNFRFKFAENANITGEYRPTVMYVNTGNAALVNTTLIMEMKNYTNTENFTDQIKWKWGETPVGNATTLVFTGKGETFYQLIHQACEGGNAEIIRRNLEGVTVKIVGGSQDLYTYILVNKPNSAVAQSKPEFTNLVATNDHPAIGLFSSRFTHSVYHPMVHLNQNYRCIDRISTMELCIGPISGAHSFCSQQPLDIAQGESWACN